MIGTPDAEAKALVARMNAGIFRALGGPKPASSLVEKVTEEVVPGEPDRGERQSPQKVSVTGAGEALDEILRRLDEQKKATLKEPGNAFVRAISAIRARGFLRGASPAVVRAGKMLDFEARRLQAALSAHETAEAQVRKLVSSVRSRLGEITQLVKGADAGSESRSEGQA